MSTPNVRVHCDGCNGVGQWHAVGERDQFPVPCGRCDGSGFVESPETFRERMEALGILVGRLRNDLVDAVGMNLTPLLTLAALAILCCVLFGITFGWR